MDKYIFHIRDVNTLKPITATGVMTAAGYIETRTGTDLEFSPPLGSHFSITINKTGYYAKWMGSDVHSTPGMPDWEIDMYLVPYPEPTPGPSDETVIGRVGSSCDLLTKSMFGRSWYSYRNVYTGYHWVWDSEADDARHTAETDPACFEIPPEPALPEAPGNVVEAIGQKIGESTSTITAKISDVFNKLQDGLGGIAAGIMGLTDKANAILGEIQQIPDRIKWPDWRTAIIAPVLAGVNALPFVAQIKDIASWDFGAIKKFVDDFRWPDWGRFFDDYIIKPLDVWVSTKLGIDPAKPFWDEISKKIIDIFIRSFDAVLDEIVPPPPPPKAGGK